MPSKLVEAAAAAKKKTGKPVAGFSKKAPAGSPPSRHLGRRDTEDAADRAIAEHFRGAPRALTHGKEVEGQTLFQRIARDKAQAKAAGTRLGSSYWANLHKLYDEEPSGDALQVKNKDEPLDPHLVNALTIATAANTTVRNKKELLSWMATATVVNQREFVGIARLVKTAKPETNQVALQLVIQCMKMVVSLKLHEAYPAEVRALTDVFDRALLNTLLAMRKSDLQEETWWQLYRPVASLVMDPNAVDRIYAEPDSWSSVATELTATVASSLTGRKLFGWAELFVVGERMAQFVSGKLDTMKDRPITAPAMKALHKQSIAEGEKNRVYEILQVNREVSLFYRGVDVKVQCSTFLDELNLRISAFIKSQAIPTLIDELPFEQGLFSAVPAAGGASGSKVAVEDSLLAEFRAARALLVQMLKQVGNEGAVIVDLLRQKSQMFLNIDKSFCIEISAFQQMHSAVGVQLAKDAVLGALPSHDSPKTLTHSNQLLAGIAEGPIYKFGDHEVRSTIDQAREIAQKLSQGIAVNKALLSSSPFLQQVLDRLPMFLKAVVEKNGTEVPEYGASAIAPKLQELEELEAAGKLTLDALTELHTFQWLATEEQSQKLQSLTQKALKGIQGSGKKKDCTTGKAEAKKKAKTDDQTAMMAKLFG